MHLSDLQAEIRNRDYKPHIPHVYVLKLMEEVGELAEAIRKRARRADGSNDIEGTIDEELFDILYYVLALANVYDVDMEEAVALKEAINAQRYGYSKALG